MTDYNHLNHTTLERKYHVIIIPKYRKKVLFGQLRKQLGPVLHELASRRESKIEAGHMMPDHVHMLLPIPPKYSLSQVVGLIKGKSAIWIAQNVAFKKACQLPANLTGPPCSTPRLVPDNVL
jgi:putative transposase